MVHVGVFSSDDVVPPEQKWEENEQDDKTRDGTRITTQQVSSVYGGTNEEQDINIVPRSTVVN